MDLDKILQKEKKLLIENYFELQIEAEKIYGKNTIILMEVGSFYEIYQYDNIGKAQEVSKILNILLTKKNKKIEETNISNPYLCGIPSVTLEKHLDKLMSEEKWTILIVKQKGTPPNIIRYVDQILSPGTTIEHINSDQYNFIAAISVSKNRQDIYYAALTMIDLSIGKTFVYENFGTLEDKELPLDEIEQIIKTHNIKELVFIFDKDIENRIINNINPMEIPYITKTEKEVKSFTDISFQNKLFETVFKSKGFLSPIEDLDLETLPLASATLSVLISFIIDHNKSIVENLKKPEKINSAKFMYLGNNPIQQLNIHSDKSISVSKIINKGITAIGRRFILEQILNPLFDKKEIKKRLSLTNKFKENKSNEEIVKHMKNIYDIERIWRKIELENLSPFELYNLIYSFEKIVEIDKLLAVEEISISKNTIDSLSKTIEKTKSTFKVDILQKYNLQNINENFICKGISKELDSLISEYENSLSLIETIHKEIEESIQEKIKVSSTETEGYYFEITKNKYEKHKLTIDSIIKDYGEIEQKKLKNSIKLTTSEIRDISNKSTLLFSKMISLVKKVFISFIKENLNESFTNSFKESVLFIAYVDFYLNNVKLLNERNYCIPEIISAQSNFFEANELRHPIVETIEDNGVFVPNNIVLGDKNLSKIKTETLFNKNNDFLNGFLLYGINSAGKTVLTKSIGIATILAQAGIPVPAKSLRLTIKDSLFTRISGEDNLQKGLSTFAIEMLELKNIFNRATKNSIVLGDEISHGTETISGMSIVASTVIELVNLNSLFVLSTHLHQLEEMKEIKELKTVTSAHLSIKYDEVKDILIYDRKLKAGSGSSVYGLEFAKSLKLPESFLNRAYKFRDEIATDLSEEKRLIKNKKSKYNAKVLVSSCSICGKEAEDIHHIKEQHMAENGFIGSTRKNHKMNLLPLCKNCHDKVHKGLIKVNGFLQTSNGIELSISEG